MDFRYSDRCAGALKVQNFWRAFQFTSTAEEEGFQARYYYSSAVACRLWCLVHLAFDVIVPLCYIQYQPNATFYMSYIPSMVVALVALLLLFIPHLLKHVILIASAGAVLMTACSVMQVCHLLPGPRMTVVTPPPPLCARTALSKHGDLLDLWGSEWCVVVWI